MSRLWRTPVLNGVRDRNKILAFTGTLQMVPGRSLEGQMDDLEHIRSMFAGNNWTGRNFAGTAWFREIKVSNRRDWHPHVNMVFALKGELERDDAIVLAQRVLDRWGEKADLGGATSVATQNAEDLVVEGASAIKSTITYASKSPAWDATGQKYSPSWTYSDLLNHALATYQLDIPDGVWAFELMREIEVATTQRPGRRSPWCRRSGVFVKNKI